MEDELYRDFDKEIAYIHAEKEHQEWSEYQEELKKSKKEAIIVVTKIPDKKYEEHFTR